MLRIGDIHIKKNRTASILETLETYISGFPDEKHIVFMGDYIYHFQYDRDSLLQLFHFFISLYKEGKHVYILAGNHDWIHNHFVYEEAQYAFALTQQEEGSLYFITTPTLFTIEGQDCLFFPYTPYLEKTESNLFKNLSSSDLPAEVLSGRANQHLDIHIKEWQETTGKSERLCVFHHWYIAETTFPGQKTTFAYKHHALSPTFAKMKDVFLVSGHIHHPFVRENYICLGSVRSTSPLEINQMKYLFRRDVQKQTLYAEPVEINPYIRISLENIATIDTMYLEKTRKEIYIESCHYLSSGNIEVICASLNSLFPLERTTLSLEHDTLSYADIETYVDKDVTKSVSQVVLKRKTSTYDVSSEDLSLATKDLDTSIANRKDLLRLYIEKKRKDDSVTYIQILEDLKILM